MTSPTTGYGNLFLRLYLLQLPFPEDSDAHEQGPEQHNRDGLGNLGQILAGLNLEMRASRERHDNMLLQRVRRRKARDETVIVVANCRTSGPRKRVVQRASGCGSTTETTA